MRMRLSICYLPYWWNSIAQYYSGRRPRLTEDCQVGSWPVLEGFGTSNVTSNSHDLIRLTIAGNSYFWLGKSDIWNVLSSTYLASDRVWVNGCPSNICRLLFTWIEIQEGKTIKQTLDEFYLNSDVNLTNVYTFRGFKPYRRQTNSNDLPAYRARSERANAFFFYIKTNKIFVKYTYMHCWWLVAKMKQFYSAFMVS